MSEHQFIRVDIGTEWQRPKLVEIFRKALLANSLLRDDYLYHGFDGIQSLDRVTSIGCDTENPTHYSCGVAEAIADRRSALYNPLDTAVMLTKPGLLVYRRRSLVLVDSQASLYRFKGKDYNRGLVAILLAKRPRTAHIDTHVDH